MTWSGSVDFGRMATSIDFFYPEANVELYQVEYTGAFMVFEDCDTITGEAPTDYVTEP